MSGIISINLLYTALYILLQRTQGNSKSKIVNDKVSVRRHYLLAIMPDFWQKREILWDNMSSLGT